MGHNVKMLMEKRAEKGLDKNHTARLELEECIHFHVDDFRFVWTTEEFLKIANMFEEAKKKVLDMGSPDYLEHMVQLGGVFLDGKCMHDDRIASEATKDGTLHLHHKNLRIHWTPMDYYEFADGVRESITELCEHMEQTIDITGNDILIPSIAHEYVKMLEDYKNSIEKVPPEEVGFLKKRMKWYERHPRGNDTEEKDLQRKSGHLPNLFPGNIPNDLNTRYLYAMYESIRKWGYASGPFDGDLMPAYLYPNGKIYLKGAHRTAALMSLGYTSIPVLLSDAPTGWTTE